MMFRSAFSFGAAIALSVSLYAQGGRPSTPTPTPTPTPTTPTNPGTIGNPSRIPFPTSPSTTTPTTPTFHRPIYPSRPLLLDDANPPPDPATTHPCHPT